MSEDNRYTDGGGFANGGQMIINHPTYGLNEQITALQAEIEVYKGSLKALNEQLAEKDKEIERLKEQLRLTNIDWQNAEAENAALREEINNPKRTFCAWCGYTVEIDDDAATGIAEHVRTCEKHPLNIEIDALRERLRPVEEVYKKHEVWAREWLSTAPVSSRSRMLEFWQAICKTMEGK